MTFFILLNFSGILAHARKVQPKCDQKQGRVQQLLHETIQQFHPLPHHLPQNTWMGGTAITKLEEIKIIPVIGYIFTCLLPSSTALAGVFLKRESTSEVKEKTKVFCVKYLINTLAIKTCFGNILLLLYAWNNFNNQKDITDYTNFFLLCKIKFLQRFLFLRENNRCCSEVLFKFSHFLTSKK